MPNSLVLFIFLLLRTALLTGQAEGFAIPVLQDLLSKVTRQKSPISKSKTTGAPTRADGDAFLATLDLKAPTEPRLAWASWQQIPNLALASVPAIARALSGVFAQGYGFSFVKVDERKYTYLKVGKRQLEETGVYNPPPLPILLYELESCPFCRKVREACSMLSLEVTFLPVPAGGRRFRAEIKSQYGSKASFPYMVDANTGVKVRGSIISTRSVRRLGSNLTQSTRLRTHLLDV